jgi:phosphatidylinositol-3-phosphatase
MVIVEENQESTSILGSSSAPYINSLATTYASATQWYSVEHNSPLDYMDLLSGANQNCCAGNPYSATTLVDELHAKSTPIPWKAYMESMPSDCYTKSSTTNGLYDVIHNPFRYFTNYWSWCSTANEGVLPYPGSSALVSTLDGSQAPDFVWITPNDCNNMHGDSNTGSPCKGVTGGPLVKAGNDWLSTNIAPVISSSWFKQNGIIIITWDEGTTSKGCCGGVATGGHIATIVVTSNNKGLGNFTGTGDHFGTLAAIEKAYGVVPLGGSASSVNGDLTGAFGQATGNLLSAEAASFEGGTTGGWGGYQSTLANSTLYAVDGTHSLAATSTVNGDMGPVSPTVPVTSGATYTGLLSERAGAGTNATAGLYMQFLDATHTEISQTSQAFTSTTSWQQVSITAVAPANAAYVDIVSYYSSTTIGEVHYIDKAQIALGTTTVWTL